MFDEAFLYGIGVGYGFLAFAGFYILIFAISYWIFSMIAFSINAKFKELEEKQQASNDTDTGSKQDKNVN